MDARYFLSPGYQAAMRLAAAKSSGLKTFRLGGKGGVAKVWKPQRIGFARAAPGEPSAPYIRPYGMFQYLPQPADMLSRRRNQKLSEYLIEQGIVLQTRSGRNLGPQTIADAYLERFVMSDDLLRVKFEDEQLRDYAVAFLSGPTGQSLIRYGKSGSVVDHVTEAHMEGQEVPVFDALVDDVTTGMRQAFRLREEARLVFSNALSSYEEALPGPDRDRTPREGWTVRASDLTGRLDAASYDPWVGAIREALLEVGGREVREVANVLKPAGRYKTIYVEPPYGRPLLSGTQILQVRPINMHYISPRALKVPEAYELRAGWTVYQADGRAEESLGIPVMVTPDRNGWLASGQGPARDAAHRGLWAVREGGEPRPRNG
jgi:hypothetical protein